MPSRLLVLSLINTSFILCKSNGREKKRHGRFSSPQVPFFSINCFDKPFFSYRLNSFSRANITFQGREVYPLNLRPENSTSNA